MRIAIFLFSIVAIAACKPVQKEVEVSYPPVPPAQNPYLQCAAVSVIAFNFHPDKLERPGFESAYMMHAKLAWWHSPTTDNAKFMEDIANARKALEAQIVDKQTAEDFVAKADNCKMLSLYSANRMMDCYNEKGVTEESLAYCAKKAAGR